MVQHHRRVREGLSQIKHIAKLRFQEPSIKGQAKTRQMFEPLAKLRRALDASRAMGEGAKDIAVGIE